MVEISNEPQRKLLIDKILKAAATMKKHKSHARHVFNFLEKNYGVSIVFNDDDGASSSKKGGTDSRKSSGVIGTSGKFSTLSKNSDFESAGIKLRGTNSTLTEKQPTHSSSAYAKRGSAVKASP